jgi:hypothetical protein
MVTAYFPGLELCSFKLVILPQNSLLKVWNRIGGVMVSVFASSAIDCGLEPRSGHTKNYKIGICCFSA